MVDHDLVSRQEATPSNASCDLAAGKVTQVTSRSPSVDSWAKSTSWLDR